MEHAPQFKDREDRLSEYLKALPKDFLFDELSPDYIKTHQLDFMQGIAVPFKTADMVSLAQTGINPASLVDNMAVVIGANTKFPYASQYIKFMARFFNEKLINVFTSKGAQALTGDAGVFSADSDGKSSGAGKYAGASDLYPAEPDFGLATAYYRMALMLDSKDMMAIFGYACACREWYLSLEDRDGFDQLIEILKSESTEYFEWCIIEHPEFAPAYYYLGFAYLNAALYSKAQFIWTRFVELSGDSTRPEIHEVKERLAQLDDPVKIEEGINLLTTGNLESGLKILEPFTESQYKNWWPLHYYLACTYRELEHLQEAIEGFKKVLELSPSNYDACKALAEIYEELGDSVNAEKYSKKSEIVLKNQE